MESIIEKKYKELSDKQIVDLIITPPPNEEAAAYLLYYKYNPMLRKVYRDLYHDFFWFDDCLGELFEHLRGKEPYWDKLAHFEWRSELSTWLKKVAKRKFIESLQKLIEKDQTISFLHNEDHESSEVQIPDNGEEEYERRQLRLLILEAIDLLEDENQKFVIKKRLEGYNSKEIAILMQKKWEKDGTVIYSSKKDGEKRVPVVPDEGYVNTRTERAKENLRVILNQLMQ